MNPLRIAIDGMLLGRRFSGVERAIVNLARALAAVGAEDYTLCVPRRCPYPDIQGPRFRTVRVGAWTHFRPLRILWEQLAAPAVLRRGRFDLLHAPGYVAPLIARTPVVLTVYDLIALLFPQWCKPANRWHYGVMLPASVRKASAIIVPSECTRADLERRLPCSRGKIVVIPLGVADEFFVPVSAEAAGAVRARYGLPTRFILFVGKTEPKKNLPRLIDAYHGLLRQGRTRLPLVIAGERTAAWPSLWRQVRARGLADHVRFTDYVPQEDLRGLYASAALFVFPSLYEGFGLPPLEAMACGVPVVASDRGALPETVGSAALTADPEDAGGLAETMERALTDVRLRKRLTAEGKARAARFSWSTAARRTEEVYRQVLTAAGGTP